MTRAESDIDKKLQEEFLIVESDTVIYPWTVMVHAGNTSATDGAVMASWGLD